ncbi:hypothetical protein [Tumebacillus avium]|uniref:hypothetical protein n=1 Tax=Tumebacillus avium TaxID=1903704 RepID=UPI0012FE383F|nr:hypothetical protein [Tumebacillus avium]
MLDKLTKMIGLSSQSSEVVAPEGELYTECKNEGCSTYRPYKLYNCDSTWGCKYSGSCC